MAYSTNPYGEATGVAAIGQMVTNSFEVKAMTIQMLQALQNPTNNWSQTCAAAQFFSAMKAGGTFTGPNGNVMSFAGMDPAVVAKLQALASTALSTPVTIPVDANGDTVPLQIVNANGSTSNATILDLIENPNATYQISFKVPDGSASPAWAPSLFGDGTFTGGPSTGDTGAGSGLSDNSSVAGRGSTSANPVNFNCTQDTSACSSSDHVTVSSNLSGWLNSDAAIMSVSASGLANYAQQDM